jgi:hypothetical protein
MSWAMSTLRRTLIALLVLLASAAALMLPIQPAHACEMWGSICVPPEAKKVIDSVARTPASNNYDLVDALAELESIGVPREEALRVGLGRFPVAGRANYVHDWLYPRFGPGIRFHQGTDVFADHGTPLRSPVDGIAKSDSNSLGGLTVKIYLPDGTYFYLAHLSGLAPGFVSGQPVKVGDVVGYVGDSGNAKGGQPHLHIGIYPQGGAAIDPKPILDRFLAEAEARLPAVVQAYRDAYGTDGPPVPAMPARPEPTAPSPPPPGELPAETDDEDEAPAAATVATPMTADEVNAAAPKPKKRASKQAAITEAVLKYGPVTIPADAVAGGGKKGTGSLDSLPDLGEVEPAKAAKSGGAAKDGAAKSGAAKGSAGKGGAGTSGKGAGKADPTPTADAAVINPGELGRLAATHLTSTLF